MGKKEAVISNSGLNSYGFRVLTEGIDTAQYERNPVLLWMHSRPYRGTTDEVLPLGRMENMRIEGDNLIGTPVFDESDDFAKRIKSKWESGMLKMVSAGLDVIETSEDVSALKPGQSRATVTKSKLIEVSIVDIGANDDALALYRDGKAINLSTGVDLLTIPLLSSPPSALQMERGDRNILNNNNKSEMKTIALKLGLPETAPAEEILSKIGNLQLAAQSAEKLQQELDKQHEKAIEMEVDSAVKLKRITSDKKSHFISLGKSAGIDSLKATLELMEPALKPTDLIVGGLNPGQTEYVKLSEVPEKKRIELRKEEPEIYKALYKAEYGVDCEFD
jgi:hypothetical protein